MKKIFNFNNVCIPYYDLKLQINFNPGISYIENTGYSCFKNKNNIDICFNVDPAHYLEYEDELIIGTKLLSFTYEKNFWLLDAFLKSTFWPADGILSLNFVGELTE